MNNIDYMARRVADSFADRGGDRQTAFDPTFILVIAQALVPLVQAVMDCIAASKVPKAAADPNLLQRIVVKNQLRNHVGRKFWRLHGNQLYEAVMSTAANSTAEQIQAIYDEVDR